MKYNKNIQKRININTINYKLFSGRYIIHENGKVKEYNIPNDELVFEGEYLKGKRSGKGVEYDGCGGIKFEGEYLNGKRHGKGIEYYNYTIFKGEYLGGNKWNGKGYNKNWNVIYELNNGKGYVKEYGSIDELKFEGQYLNGKKNGKGKSFYNNGSIKFEGEYLNGKKWNGKGYDMSIEKGKKILLYELINGKGYVKKPFRFEGEYLNGRKNGKGKTFCFSDDKLSFEGEYLNGKKNGKGKEYDYDKKLKFEGEYLYDYRIKGKEYIKERLVFEGEYLFNRNWTGKWYDEKGNIIGELINGNGFCREYDYDRTLIYEGGYLNGKRNGKGKEYYHRGSLMFEGEYLEGKQWTGRGYYPNKDVLYELNNGEGYVEENDRNFNLIFRGYYVNGERNGSGKEFHYPRGQLKFEGQYLSGKRNGKGMEYNEYNGFIFEGEYLNGERNGKGIEYDDYLGDIIFEGEYLHGRKWNGKGRVYYYNGEVKLEYDYINGSKKIKDNI